MQRAARIRASPTVILREGPHLPRVEGTQLRFFRPATPQPKRRTRKPPACSVAALGSEAGKSAMAAPARACAPLQDSLLVPSADQAARSGLRVLERCRRCRADADVRGSGLVGPPPEAV